MGTAYPTLWGYVGHNAIGSTNSCPVFDILGCKIKKCILFDVHGLFRLLEGFLYL